MELNDLQDKKEYYREKTAEVKKEQQELMGNLKRELQESGTGKMQDMIKGMERQILEERIMEDVGLKREGM